MKNGAEIRISTGIPGLDSVLSGGLPSGHFFLFEGDPGTGKTTIAIQFLLEGAARGERVMYVTLSESIQELKGVAHSHGWPLDNVSIFEFTPREEILRGEEQYSAFHPSEIEFQDTTQMILEQVEKLTPQRLVFDSLSELRLLARDSLRYRRQILALKHFFAKRNCTVLLLDDGTGDHQDRQLESIAHGVIRLEKLNREYGVTRRRLEVSKLRGSKFREGYHDYKIETGGVVVFPRLIAAEHRRNVSEGTIGSGIPELDALWGDGLARGTSTLVVGPAGSGKSTLALSYAVNAAKRGELAVCFTFEESMQTLFSRAGSLGMDLTPWLETGRLIVEQIDPAEQSPGEFLQRIQDLVEGHGARVIVIDSLNGYLAGTPEDRYLPLQMHETLSYLNEHGVATFLILAQSGLIGHQMQSPVDVSYLADNVLLLRFFEAQGRVRKALSVVKKRSGAHEDTIREIQMTRNGVSVGQPLAEFAGILTGVPMYLGSDRKLAGNHDVPSSPGSVDAI